MDTKQIKEVFTEGMTVKEFFDKLSGRYTVEIYKDCHHLYGIDCDFEGYTESWLPAIIDDYGKCPIKRVGIKETMVYDSNWNTSKGETYLVLDVDRRKKRRVK